MKLIQRLSLLAILLSQQTFAEQNSAEWDDYLTLEGYLEAYYIKDFNHPRGKRRPDFTYSHHVTDKPSINLAFIKTSLNHDNFRAHFALGSGTYMRANYEQEPRDLQKIVEANIGVRLDDRLWLDVGVLPSHIGFESAIGIENWTVTRSMLADNSPYFETGARVSYISDDGRWYVSGLVLNGWQRIQRPDGNTTPSLGHQITYKPHPKLTVNSSSFVGNDRSDRDRRMRYFHNFYIDYALTDRVGILGAFDIGAEQISRGSSRYHVWLSPVAILKYQHSDRLSVATRLEYYQDRNEVIVETTQGNGFNTYSYSVNLDYRFSKQLVMRAEVRKFYSQEKIFQRNNGFSDQSLVATTAITLQF